MEIASVIVAVIAALAAVYAAFATKRNAEILKKYSRINITHSINEIMLKKSADCNVLWKQARLDIMHPQAQQKYVYANTISEVTISIQLLNNCLSTYNEEDKRNFLLLQFWIQLDTSFREFIKDENSEALNEQMTNIRSHFNQFFKKF